MGIQDVNETEMGIFCVNGEVEVITDTEAETLLLQEAMKKGSEVVGDR